MYQFSLFLCPGLERRTGERGEGRAPYDIEFGLNFCRQWETDMNKILWLSGVSACAFVLTLSPITIDPANLNIDTSVANAAGGGPAVIRDWRRRAAAAQWLHVASVPAAAGRGGHRRARRKRAWTMRWPITFGVASPGSGAGRGGNRPRRWRRWRWRGPAPARPRTGRGPGGGRKPRRTGHNLTSSGAQGRRATTKPRCGDRTAATRAATRASSVEA